jgi:hypothetical protein
MTIAQLMSYGKEELPDVAQNLTAEDIAQLVEWLSEKDDAIRYPSFLLLKSRSARNPGVYPHWDVFVEKLDSANSYQRSIGLILMAENARWDDDGKLDAAIDRYLSFCDDQKPVTVRQCIQALCRIVPYKKHLCGKIQDKLTSIDISERKESQRKLVLLDIISVLALIRKQAPDEEIDSFLFGAVGSGYFDKQTQKEVEALLREA